MEKRSELGDPEAMKYLAGICFLQGQLGVQQDKEKALELLQKAADLGCISACSRLGKAYLDGDLGLKSNLDKCILFWEPRGYRVSLNSKNIDIG